MHHIPTPRASSSSDNVDQSYLDQARRNSEERCKEAARFLHEISPNGEGLINIRYGTKQAEMGAVKPNRNKYWPANDLDNAAVWVVKKADAGHDMYAAIAPRSEKSGKKAAIEQCWLAYADVDSPEAHARLEELPCPSFTIASGGAGNMHAYWRLESPVSADGLEMITKPLDAHLSAGTQHVFDASHILRIPGTYSFKYNDQRPISYLSDTDEDEVYEPAEIIESDTEPTDARTDRSGDRNLSGVTYEGENRGHKLCQYAARLRLLGIVGDDALADLLTYNQNHCDPPKDYKTVEQIHRDYVISNETPPDAKEGKGNAIAIPYSKIEPEQVEWLWRECIPRGMITLLGGREGLGKRGLRG